MIVAALPLYKSLWYVEQAKSGRLCCMHLIHCNRKKNDESISRPNIGQNPHVLSSYWSKNFKVSRVRARSCATGPHAAFKVGSTAVEHGKAGALSPVSRHFPGPYDCSTAEVFAADTLVCSVLQKTGSRHILII